MTLKRSELLKAAEMVAERKEMRATIKGSMFGAATTAVTTFLGGLIAGPVGIMFGATGGGLLSYTLTKDSFKPVATILREDLTPAQQNKLADHLANALKDIDITDLIALVSAIQCQEAVLMIIFKTVKNFMENDCMLSVTA